MPLKMCVDKETQRILIDLLAAEYEDLDERVLEKRVTIPFSNLDGVKAERKRVAQILKQIENLPEC